jgi:hypothetical protein
MTFGFPQRIVATMGTLSSYTSSADESILWSIKEKIIGFHKSGESQVVSEYFCRSH